MSSSRLLPNPFACAKKCCKPAGALAAGRKFAPARKPRDKSAAQIYLRFKRRAAFRRDGDAFGLGRERKGFVAILRKSRSICFASSIVGVGATKCFSMTLAAFSSAESSLFFLFFFTSVPRTDQQENRH